MTAGGDAVLVAVCAVDDVWLCGFVACLLFDCRKAAPVFVCHSPTVQHPGVLWTYHITSGIARIDTVAATAWQEARACAATKKGKKTALKSYRLCLSID